MTGSCITEHLAHDACGFLSDKLFTCRHADKAAGLETQSVNNGLLSVLKELGYTACKLAVFIYLEPVGLGTCLNLDLGAELVDILAGHVAIGDDDSLNGVALGKGRKLRSLHQLSDILNDEVNTQVGLIRAVLFHGFIKAYAPKRCLGGDIISTVFCKYRGQDILDDRKNIVLVGKGHLHIELIKFAG